MATELRSAYLFDTRDVMTTGFMACLEQQSAWLDIHRVGGGTGADAHGTLVKQLRGAGAAIWSGPRAPDPQHAITLRLWMYTSDGGPDQSAFKKAAKLESHTVAEHLWFDAYCLHHVSELAYKSGLMRID
eukprot:9910178-Lingulodinium_polyedra.AAC.1